MSVCESAMTEVEQQVVSTARHQHHHILLLNIRENKCALTLMHIHKHHNNHKTTGMGSGLHGNLVPHPAVGCLVGVEHTLLL